MKRRDFVRLTGLSAAMAAHPNFLQAAETKVKASPSALHEAERDIPVIDQADVIVCGAGPAGIAAALASARRGAKTVLIETQGCLGGIWTAGALSWILDYDNKPGIMREILDQLVQRGARAITPNGKPSNGYDVEEMKLLLEDLCLEAKVSIHLHTRITGVAKNSKNELTHVIIESKSGREALAGKRFIDGTGDGDVGALAGCRFEVGHPETGKTQPMSMMALLTGIDPGEIQDYFREMDGEWAPPKDRLRKEMERGGNSPSYSKPTLFRIRNDLFSMMANHEYGFLGINARDVTHATLNARREAHALVRGLRSLGGPWKNLRIVATSAQIGVRGGRRLRGLYQVTADDLKQGARHEDAICRVEFGIDVHSTDPGKQKGIEAKSFRSQSYDIPLRALIASDVKGLMMAGRCISGDFIAHSSYRVTGNAVAMGEAAGKVAAWSARANRPPQEVPLDQL